MKNQVSTFELEKKALSEKVAQLTQKKDALEQYIEDFTEEMSAQLEGAQSPLSELCMFLYEPYLRMLTFVILLLTEYCRDAELETERIERELDPARSLVRDKAALGILRLEARLEDALGYIIHLRGAVGRIDKELWLEETLQNDLETMMARLSEIPRRVQVWKKSSARCGADVALSLVRVHCKDVNEEKLKSLKVANTKKQ